MKRWSVYDDTVVVEPVAVDESRAADVVLVVIEFNGVLLNASRLQPWSNDVDIGDDNIEFDCDSDHDGTPIFSRVPQWRWTSALGWLANKTKQKRKRQSRSILCIVIDVESIQTFIDNPEAAAYSRRSTVEINIQKIVVT
jgi:hypothetical protein